MPMIAGILAKVRRSGEMSTIGAHVVYEGDAFTYVLGDEERIEHKPSLVNRGNPIAAYAIAHTKDGGIYREVMTLEQITQVRNVSKAKNSGPWSQWWDEMARKTVLRRLSKRLPMSTDLVQLFDRDNDHYDLRGQAQSEATLRRLHADFDEPGPPAAAQVTDAAFEDATAADDRDGFPGDQSTTDDQQQAHAPHHDAQQRPAGVAPASQVLTTVKARKEAFEAHAKKAPTSVALKALRDDRHFTTLCNDIDAGDPDEVGTGDELRNWLESIIERRADEELDATKGGAQ
jgi:recombination protein RecT